MKDNKVHTVNKYNKVKWERPLFLSDNQENLYWFGGKVWEGIKDGFGNVSFGGWEGLGEALGQGASRILGVQPDLDYDTYEVKTGSTTQVPDPLSTPAQQDTPNQGAEKHAYGGPIITGKVNRFAEGGAAGGSGLLGGLSGGMGSIGSAIGGAIGGAISNGYTSGVGNVMNTVGKIASVIPGPWGAAISGGLQILGGGVNALFGTKVDQAKLQAANKGTNALNNFKSSAANFDAIKMATAQAGVQDAYSGGAFRKGWAEERNKRLHQQRIDARQFASRSVSNNINNLVSDQINNSLANYSAFGGPLFAKGGRLFEIGGPTYGINNIPSEFYDIMDTSRQPEIDRLKEENAGFNVDDYFYRVKKQHPEVSKEQVVDAYNSIPIVASGSKVRYHTAGIYHPGDETGYGNRIMVYPSNMKADDGVGGYTKEDRISNNIAHEVNHMYMDKVLGGNYTDAENAYLDAAFPKSKLPKNEERAYIMEFRNALSNQYNDAKEEALDKVLDKGASDDDVAYHWNQNVPEEMRIKKVKGKWDPKRIKAIREAGKYVAFNPTSNEASLFNMANYGGDLDIIEDSNSMDATRLNLAYDLIGTKRKNAENKDQMTNLFAGNQTPLFAFGGDMQSNSADWGTGLTHIDAGGSHEQNPNDGVQMGVDSEGTPNLVEEGEVIYNDYVYSARIPIDKITKKKFHFPRKKEMTYAEAAKKLEKEIAERPNDPISQAGFKSQMETLAEQQERQKQEMEAERAKAAFEALSPEEQTAIMQRAAQEEQMAQQAAQEQAMAEQQAMQQPSPEEAAMAQQMQADGSEAMVGQEPQAMAAYGGKVYRFDDGGELKKKLYTLLGRATDSDFKKWLEEMGEGKLDYEAISKAINEGDWESLRKNEGFIKALSKENRGLAHSISLGNNFGTFTPKSDKATIKSINRGNWKATNGVGWLGSDDPAWLEATEGMSEDDIKKLSTEDVAKLMRATNSYKKGTEWLQNKDNALLYLNTLIEDNETPEVAKEYAKKFVKDGQWKDGFNYDYATVFGSNGKGVRETDPGTYWHTPVEAVRGKKTENYLLNDDGTAELITGTTDGLTAAGTYSWQGADNDMTANYFTRPMKAVAKEAEKTPEQKQIETDKVAPPKNDPLRYAGLLGPVVGLGMQMAGVGKPDYSGLDAAVANSGNVVFADYKPLGDYMTYRPMDIWYQQNALNAQARATDRAIANGTSPSKAAALLASGYNSQLASGNLYRQAREYNDAQREKVAQFNRGTNQYNSDQYGQTSRFNADAWNRSSQFNSQMQMAAAREKLENDAGWYNSIYGNVGQIFKGLGDLGRENTQQDWIRWLREKGAFGVVSAEGGKLKKKRKGDKLDLKL